MSLKIEPSNSKDLIFAFIASLLFLVSCGVSIGLTTTRLLILVSCLIVVGLILATSS